MQYSLFLILGWLILGLLSVISLSVGAMSMDLADNIQALWGNAEPHIVFIVQQLRLPRTLLCIFIGVILALCGAVLQGLI